MLKITGAFALAFAWTTGASATVTYDVNQVIALGNVTGTIQTNGNVGILGQSDIVAFDLLLGGPGVAIELTQADSVIVTQGANLRATLSDLIFDYSGPDGYLLFQFEKFGTGMRYYCNSSANNACFQGASVLPDSFNSPSTQVELRNGIQVIASNGRTSTSAVPEPATWTMMLVGFGAMGTAMRRRRVAVNFS